MNEMAVAEQFCTRGMVFHKGFRAFDHNSHHAFFKGIDAKQTVSAGQRNNSCDQSVNFNNHDSSR